MPMNLKNIILAVNELIEREFPTVEIQSNDVKEGFKRPSFFVELDGVSKDTRLYSYERELTVRIYYFPKSRHEYSLETLDIQEKLEEIFGLTLPIEGRPIIIDGTSTSIVDGVVQFDIDLSFSVRRDVIDPGEPMQELDFRKKG